MATYLERYLAGEHERVWDELIALGSSVREEPVYSDALAVAYELMWRVRRNLETLIPRLVGIGYEFGYGWAQPARDSPYDWRARKAYSDMVWRFHHGAPLLSTAPDVEAQLADQRARYAHLLELDAPRIILDNEERMIAELDAQPRQAALVDELERLAPVPLNLSLRAWFEVVDSVNFVGVHPAWLRLLIESGQVSEEELVQGYDPEAGGHPFSQLEPLHITSLSHVTQLCRESVDLGLSNGMTLDLIYPGVSTYVEMGNGYEYRVELGSTADAVVKYEPVDISFVGYLRRSLRWGGFPGWQRLPVKPERDLATLTSGQIPF